MSCKAPHLQSPETPSIETKMSFTYVRTNMLTYALSQSQYPSRQSADGVILSNFRETVTSLWKTERDNFTRLAESQQKLSSQQHRQAYDLFSCLHESLEGFVACVQRCFKQDTWSVARAMISSVAVQSDNLSGVCVFQARTAIWGVAGREGTCVR